VWALLALALAGAPSMTPAALRGHVRFLASDALEGRGPGTPGDQLAQQYLATQLETYGLEPAAPGGRWVQPVELISVTGAAQALTLKAGKETVRLTVREDFMAVAGDQAATTKVDSAELVFVGYGITAPEYRWDDFKDVDVRGKVLVVLNNDPEDDPALFAGRTRLWYGRWDYKFLEAKRRGAAGCLIIHTTGSAGYPWQVVQASWAGEQFELPGSGGGLQLKGWVTEDATTKLVQLAGKRLGDLREAARRRDFKPVRLGVTLSATWANTVGRRTTGNVLGLIRGADPKLADEVVVITAHHDHLGRKPGAAAGEDAIYNGAVDNAGGVAALLCIAHALAQHPEALKRSVLIAAVAAEEQGLLGSQWLVEHPPISVTRMVAALNLDGLNIFGRTRDISVIGLGKSSLDEVISRLAKAQGRVVKADGLADRGFFYRSDQFNFARAGVPSAYFTSGEDYVGRPEGWGREQRARWEAQHYHQPSDELRDGWDLTGAVDDAQLYADLAVAVSNAPSGPTWTPGDEFEAVRARSLEAK
jgi:Zn-dependent M28 family amino/carboxypeptidase